MEHLLGLLRIRVQRGRNLAVRDVRSSDPYIVVKMGKQKLKTRVVKKSVNPEWNEDLTLSISDSSHPIHIAVYDKDTFTQDDKMGDAEIEIGPFLEAIRMRLDGVANGMVASRVEPSKENCLAEQSCIIYSDGNIIQNMTVRLRSILYWVLFCLQFPIAFVVFGYEAIKLYKDYKKRLSTGNSESICEASIAWTPMNIAFCALCGILGGTVGGLLGSGGGFILGPLLLEIGVIPQVASATATFVMMFSASLSVVEFYLLKRFPIPYALYLTSVSILAGFWGQFLVRKIVTFLKRASIIVFVLSAVIFASAITMGVTGFMSSLQMIKDGEFMGFLDFCSSQ